MNIKGYKKSAIVFFFSMILSIVFLSSAEIFPDKAFAQTSQSDIIYQIFVRSFYDSNGDGIGDLRGIAQKFDDYLNDGNLATENDLEVDILWLMPIFPANDYHGYNVKNYKDINPEYGTLSDFEFLIDEAHKRGVRIILDIPFNHSSNQHPWFTEAIDDSSSKYREYYFIDDSNTIRGQPWRTIKNTSGQQLSYLGLFDTSMPDLNFNNLQVKKTVKEIAKFWLDLGVDGFRLDAAKHIYGDTFGDLDEKQILDNNDWWREFSHFVYNQNQKAILVGEVLGNPEMLRRHAWGLDALVDEPFMEHLRNQVSFPTSGFVQDHKNFVDASRDLNRKAYDTSLPFPDIEFQSFVFAASHDKNPRLASDLEERKRRGMQRSIDEAYRLAMYSLLTIDRYPIIYAGDELMQRGWKWNGDDGSGIYDETLREPLPWYQSGMGSGQTTWFTPRFDEANDGVSVEEQESNKSSILSLVKSINNLRAQHPTLAQGDIGNILTDSSDWLVFERVVDSDKYVVLINQTSSGKNYQFKSDFYPEHQNAQLIYWSDGSSKKWQNVTSENKSIEDSIFVPPFGLVILHSK